MRLLPPRLAAVLLGDRLVAVAIDRARIEAFIVEADKAADGLRAELDQRHLAPRSVAIGLPRSAATVKPIDLPAVNGETRDMIRFELERHLPFPAEDAPFDYSVLPADTNGAASGTEAARRVLIVAADRRVVEGALRIAEEAHLRPVSITVAAHNLLALVGRVKPGRFLWLHRAGDRLEALLLSGAMLVLSRSLPGSEAAIADEVRRTMDAAHWKTCDEMWVSGDPLSSAAHGELAALGVSVCEPPYTAQARRQLAAVTDGPRGDVELALAVALGGRARPLELLPEPLRPRRFTRPQIITAGMGAAVVLLAIGALLAPGFRENRRLSALNAQVARLEPDVRAVEKIVQELERKRRLIDTVQSIETNSMRPLPVLRELTELLPPDAWLTTLSLDAKGVELTGQAAAAAALIPILENSPRLERVEFSSPVTRGRDREQFRIRAAWEAMPSAPTPPARSTGPAPPPAAPPRPGLQPPPAGGLELPTPPGPPPQQRRPANPNVPGAPR